MCKENDEIKQGDRFGIIRFGSRVDLYFENYQIIGSRKSKNNWWRNFIAKKK